MNSVELERAVSQDLIHKYGESGYILIEDPQAIPLPSSIGTYVPDLVLEKDGRFLAIEIKDRKVPSLARALDEIKRRFEMENRWTFEVIYLDALEAQPKLPVESRVEIDATLEGTRALAETSQYKPAFLLLWAALEATARSLETRSFVRPQSPARIITVLAEQGYINADEASTLRRLALKRNALIHGELSIKVTLEDFDAVLSVIEQVLQQPDGATAMAT